jgi:archaemetzincin
MADGLIRRMGMMLLSCMLGAVAATPKTEQRRGPSPSEMRETMGKLRPLHTPKIPPREGDWLAIHAEPGQTFREYLDCEPTLPRGRRSVLYLQPLGAFTPTQQRIVGLTAEFLGLFYNLRVKTLPPIPLTAIPKRAQRIHPAWRTHQILTSYVLQTLLKPRVPKDAAALLALTAEDLWPRDGWNFVFGEASLNDRVGIWSIQRFGNPDQDEAGFRLCLLRTLGAAAHETGHMFSMLHCTLWECLMCGSESLWESDQQPLEVCPECLAKLCWATRTDPKERFQRLADFCARNALAKEAAFYQSSLRALTP